MALQSICMACRQTLRQHSHRVPPIRVVCNTRVVPPDASRLISTHHRLSAVQANPQSSVTQATPPPQSPKKSEIPGPISPRDLHPSSRPPPYAPPSPEELHPSNSPAPSDPIETLAKRLRKKAPSVTETYVAYGACEKLVQECARQADYTIPQAREKNIDIPKSKDGEDLGVGTGWWFESTLSRIPRICKMTIFLLSQHSN